jgi:pSer/pThr/pTyr-binding forkhead associated (FHA) protein
VGWALGEPLNVSTGSDQLFALYGGVFLYFFFISAAIGAALGCLPGVLNRSRRQMLRGALLAAVVGGILGGIGALPAQYIFNALGDGLTARAVGWAIVGAAIGVCPGVATRDKWRSARGFVGGAIGGFLGGLLFNLIAFMIPAAPGDTGTASRLAADLIVGTAIGTLVAAVEVALRSAWLTVLNGRREGAEFILSKDRIAIGRDDRDDVVLWGDPLMALRHAQIRQSRRGYVLEALPGGASTLVNGQAATGPTALHDGDEIQLGSTRLLFRARRAATVPGTAPAIAVATKPARWAELPSSGGDAAAASVVSAVAEPHRAAFRLVGSDGRIVPLPDRPVVRIGRAPGNDIVLADAAVSWRHAELRRHDNRWMVVDFGSTNGTYVGGDGTPDSIQPLTQHTLHDGETVRFGQLVFRLECALDIE